jgi:hypothetical protein
MRHICLHMCLLNIRCNKIFMKNKTMNFQGENKNISR